MPTSETALVILLLAIAPGYIATSTWARARTWEGRSSDLRTVIQAIVLSAVVQAVLSPLTVVWIIPVRKTLANYPARVTVWVLLAVLVIPVAIGLGWGWVTDKFFDPVDERVRGTFPRLVNRVVHAPAPPSIWDWFFTADRAPARGFLVIEFNDGNRIAGAFANSSLVLTSPEPHGLFLEREWEMDEEGNVVNELPGSRGILIPSMENVTWIRVLVSEDDA